MLIHTILYFRVSDEPSPSERAQIAKVKTAGMKKGLAKEKNLLAAKKKDILSKQLHLQRS